jgi:hypothetical protein
MVRIGLDRLVVCCKMCDHIMVLRFLLTNIRWRFFFRFVGSMASTGNRGHLTVTKQVMRILGSLWGQIRVAFTRLRLIRSPDEEERRSR